VVDDGRRGRWLLVHDGALFRRRIAHHVVFLVNRRGLRQRRRGNKCNKPAAGRGGCLDILYVAALARPQARFERNTGADDTVAISLARFSAVFG
jgi:hypothetical protein